MSLKYILCLAVSILVNYADGKEITITCNDVPGYYWRDYVGELPDDAVPGGIDKQGRTTYIGLTLHPGASILSGTIRHNEQKIFYEYGRAGHSSTEDVKILCSQHPDQLQWVSTYSGYSVTTVGIGNQLVLGGHDRSRPLAIGRKTISTGETVVSKVLTINNKFESIYLANEIQAWSDSGPYEVLCYNRTTLNSIPPEVIKQIINININ